MLTGLQIRSFVNQRRNFTAGRTNASEIERDAVRCRLPAGIEQNLSPRIYDQRMPVGNTAVGVLTALGGCHDKGAVFDRPGTK